jgi:hypothetical protein
MSTTDNQETKQIVVPSKELLTALSSIQLASSRGAYRPEEFTEIGTAYQKLYQFLVDLNVITPPQADQPSPPSA